MLKIDNRTKKIFGYFISIVGGWMIARNFTMWLSDLFGDIHPLWFVGVGLLLAYLGYIKIK